MRIVIVTGAGASCRLGRERDLPLMGEWSSILRKELDDVESGFSHAIGLEPDMWADEFEEVVGALFALQGSMSLVERFVKLGGPQPGSITNEVQNWLVNIKKRFERIVESLHITLYREFGVPSIDPVKAESAIRGLLEPLGAKTAPVVFATTNYDPVLEIGLKLNGLDPNDGFRELPGETPFLDPEGMIDWGRLHGNRIPVLHLHGAVGWYATPKGRITRQYPDQSYNPSLGVPAILPPDPNKDPFGNAYVEAVWREFNNALQGATHVLVLGHSLRDTPLLTALGGLPERIRIAVTRHDASTDPETAVADAAEEEEDEQALKPKTEPTLERATMIPADFGPDPSFGDQFHDWLSG